MIFICRVLTTEVLLSLLDEKGQEGRFMLIFGLQILFFGVSSDGGRFPGPLLIGSFCLSKICYRQDDVGL